MSRFAIQRHYNAFAPLLALDKQIRSTSLEPALIELVLMRAMYPNRRLNIVLAVGAVIVMLLCWFGIRQQAGVSDRQFVRSMIPHHSGALLMCRQNRLTDPELQQLCRDIIASQEREIGLMKSKLK